MPCYNEAETLPLALASIERQTVSPVEILVAEGGSTDGTQALLERWSERLPLRVLENPRRRPSFGLNRCMRASGAPLLARMDGHSRWNAAYLERLLETLGEDSSLAAAGGRVEIDPRAGAFEQRVWFCMSHPLGTGAPTYRTGEEPGPVPSLQCPVYRREALESVGGFREDLPWAEDDELHHRLREAGWNLRLEPAARLYYRPRGTLGSFAAQFYRYGRGRGRLSRESVYPDPRHRTIDRVLMVWTGLLAWNPLGWLLAGTYLIGVLGRTLFESVKGGRGAVWLAVLFPVMHAGYWLGWLRERIPR